MSMALGEMENPHQLKNLVEDLLSKKLKSNIKKKISLIYIYIFEKILYIFLFFPFQLPFLFLHIFFFTPVQY